MRGRPTRGWTWLPVSVMLLLFLLWEVCVSLVVRHFIHNDQTSAKVGILVVVAPVMALAAWGTWSRYR
jgi:hypothetical protein